MDADIDMLNGSSNASDDTAGDEHYCPALPVKLQQRLLQSQQYWYNISVPGSWRLNPTAVSWDNDVPFIYEVKYIFYIECHSKYTL